MENQTISNAWVNYGDVSPIEHGGIFVKKESETTFRIIKLQFVDDEEKNLLWDCYVDITDSWIEKESVIKTCCDYITEDKPEFNVHFAIACTDYYSPANFGCNEDIFLTLDESAEYLEVHYGITEECFK